MSNSGSDFSAEGLKNAFELFTSSENLMSNSEGTGLSLAAAKMIMNLHEFEIRAANNDSGGACIKMRVKRS